MGSAPRRSAPCWAGGHAAPAGDGGGGGGPVCNKGILLEWLCVLGALGGVTGRTGPYWGHWEALLGGLGGVTGRTGPYWGHWKGLLGGLVLTGSTGGITGSTGGVTGNTRGVTVRTGPYWEGLLGGWGALLGGLVHTGNTGWGYWEYWGGHWQDQSILGSVGRLLGGLGGVGGVCVLLEVLGHAQWALVHTGSTGPYWEHWSEATDLSGKFLI